MYSANVLTASIPMSLPHFKAGIFRLTNAIPEIFSFNDQMFTTPPPHFITFFIFVITWCASEALITLFYINTIVHCNTDAYFNLSIFFSKSKWWIIDYVHDGFVKSVETAASIQKIATATWLHVSPMPANSCNNTTQSLLSFLKLFKVYEMSH